MEEVVTVMKQEVLVGFRTEFYFTCVFLKEKASTNWKWKDLKITFLTLVDKTKHLSLQRKLYDESIGVQCM